MANELFSNDETATSVKNLLCVRQITAFHELLRSHMLRYQLRTSSSWASQRHMTTRDAAGKERW
ncbi:hypothetical protein SAMN06265222_1011151 [Neorhodopirellula lusitana]|uniref:Uncharacterized protein n=1 Tax=Neorhodopirellula lusitana TaxID=445327 RepID=A0ABY1PUK9_9BACT|nr:hypothetical protein SAMN06265222_1011151 [Neorhodopirellula lusitana]